MRVGLLVAVAGAYACACHKEGPPPPPPPTPAQLEVVTPTRVVDSAQYLASLRPRTATALRPQVQGEVTAILVRAGETVKAGDVLVTIDAGPQQAAVQRAGASRKSREATLRLAEINFARVKTLVERGAVPRQELDDAQSQLESARNDVLALRADIASSQAQLRYYQITAPTEGTVGDIPIRVGSLVTPQTPVTSVTDNQVLEANISIPSERAHEVRVGTTILVVDDAGREIARGAVWFVSPQVDTDTQSVLIKAYLDNRKGRLRAEQIVAVRVVWREGEGIKIPALAVTRLGEQAFVYVAEASGKALVARQRPVQLGELTDNAYEVKRGLHAGERIVVSNIQKIRDGAPIQPAPRAEAGAGSGSAAPRPQTESRR